MESEKDLSPVDILMVDDREENLLALEAVLENPSYNLVKVSSGSEALRYLLDHEPALILMDVQMPEMDGFETVALIKESSRTRDIPVIFITAINKEERYIARGYAGGAVDYLFKPFDPLILASKVATFADLFRKSRRLLRAEQLLREGEVRERQRQLALLELKSLRREQAIQERYLELIEGLEQGVVWVASPETLMISFMSPGAGKLLGYAPEAWRNDPKFWIRKMPESDRIALLGAIEGLRESSENRSVSLEHRFLGGDGRTLWLHTAVRLGRNADTGAEEIRGLSMDVTKLKEAEKLLSLNKERSDLLAEASFLLGGSLDHQVSLDEVARLVVPRWADLFLILRGAEVAAAEGPDVSPELLQKLGGFFGAACGDLQCFHDLHSWGRFALAGRILRPSVAQLAAGLNAVGLQSGLLLPLKMRGRHLGCLLLAQRDEVARAEHQLDSMAAEGLARRVAAALDNADLYQQAQDAIRAREDFLSIASHELKTPVTPLKLQTQVLLRNVAGTNIIPHPAAKEKFQKGLMSCDRQINRLGRLIDDLLDLSRMGAGKLELQLEDFDLVELLREVVDRFSGELARNQCSVEVNVPPAMFGRWDRLRMDQVISNLLSNAMKYGGGKPIAVKAELHPWGPRLSFRDHGIGIAKEDQHRIFHRFERAASLKHFGGLGLGLYIVSQILEAHGGRIGVESEKGAGAVFYVDLPHPELGKNDHSFKSEMPVASEL